MLLRLVIQNYALIDELNIEFSDKLSIITGETGAGKSILLGALSLILGQRADTKVLLNVETKCIVEGHFNLSRLGLEGFFEINDLDFDETTIIRREITPAGKSRAFINDTPVNLPTLKELGSCLVDVHSQHETLNLKSSEFQLAVIDSFAQHSQRLSKYGLLYRDYKANEARLSELMESEKQANTDLDYYNFQINELQEANLQEDEQQNLEDELKVLSNAEEIKTKLNQVQAVLSENENSIVNNLTGINDSILSVSEFHSKLAELNDRLNSVLIELKDITVEISSLEQDTNFDQQRVEELTDRLDLIYQLEQKHRVQTVAELIDILNNLNQRMITADSLGDEINNLEESLNKQRIEILELAKIISGHRVVQINRIEEQIKDLLNQLGLGNAILEIEHDLLPENQFNANGIDKIKFLFSANKGVKPMEIGDVASGGELSRLMLCIKSLITESSKLPTIIFDEIDTGVSGEIAFKTGEIMKSIAKDHQVISITHLPQIAGKGNTHYYVYKEEGEETTSTLIKKLSRDERIVEIAKMIGGERPTDTAVKSAKELLSN